MEQLSVVFSAQRPVLRRYRVSSRRLGDFLFGAVFATCLGPHEALPASMDRQVPPLRADISLALGSGQIMCSLHRGSEQAGTVMLPMLP
jgi:hypothetical protein